MTINRTEVIYKMQLWLCESFDSSTPAIARKIEHSFSVASLMAAEAEHLFPGDTDLAWLIGLLHDIGRFLQWQRYKSFNDQKTEDHAVISNELLFGADAAGIRLIDRLAPGISAEDAEIVRLAIFWHNQASISSYVVDARTLSYITLLRDADILDNLLRNLKVDDPHRLAGLMEANGFSLEAVEPSEVSGSILDEFLAGRSIDRKHHAIEYPADLFLVWAGYYHNLTLPSSKQLAFRTVADSLLNPQRFENLATHAGFKVARRLFH